VFGALIFSGDFTAKDFGVYFLLHTKFIMVVLFYPFENPKSNIEEILTVYG